VSWRWTLANTCHVVIQTMQGICYQIMDKLTLDNTSRNDAHNEDSQNPCPVNWIGWEASDWGMLKHVTN